MYATGTSWELQYEVTRRQQAGSVLTVQVKIDGYPLNQLTASYRIRVAAGALSVTPPDLGIGEPITVMVSGLEAHITGYSMRLSNGPFLEFNGSATFQTDRVGEFTGQSMIPVDYHEDFATTAGYIATIYVYDSARDRVPGVFATVTLNTARYVAPTPTPTITPTPTSTPDTHEHAVADGHPHPAYGYARSPHQHTYTTTTDPYTCAATDQYPGSTAYGGPRGYRADGYCRRHILRR